MPKIDWHSQTFPETITSLKTNPNGLDETEVKRRLGEFGLNKLAEEKKLGWLRLLLRQFQSPLVYLLFIAGGVTIWLHETTDTIVILLSVAVNTGIGFYQEFHSGNVFDSLKKTVKTTGIVMRNNEPREILADQIVPGDIILLKTGLKIPADARLISERDLNIDESLLTGESKPVSKTTDPLSPQTPLADRSNMVFMGTVTERGEGVAVVVTTGSQTEIGAIAELTRKVEDESTPLQERISRLGQTLIAISVSAILLIFALGILEGRGFAEMLTTSVAIAVAAIPEGLPAAIAVVLAVGAQRVYRKKGLIRRLVAAETLGSVSVICTDKTGTLTEGKMKLEKLLLGDANESDKQIAMYALGLSNEALLETQDGKSTINGDSTDQAKMVYFLGAGNRLQTVLTELPRITLLSFSSETKYLASFHNDKGKTKIFITGAPEVLLKIADGADSGYWLSQNNELASQGFRIIGIAEKTLDNLIPANADQVNLQDQIHGIRFLGIAAIRDPIRPDVKETIQKTRGAGVTVVMITGDNRLTARAIGKELGFLDNSESIIDGEELDRLSEDEFIKRIRSLAIYARVSPAHKMRIVQAWQKIGETVAMTGDGVNDAPSLKAADIGIGVGGGTDVAKDASDLILIDNSLTTITAAIEQGRIAFDNIRKVVVFLLNGTFTEVLIILGALLFKLPLPLTAVQILWVNLIEDGLPNFALAFEPGEPDVMNRPPLPRKAPIINKESAWIIFFAGIVSDVLLVGLFIQLDLHSIFSLAEVQTIFFAAVGSDALFNIFALKSLKQPLYRTKFGNNPYLLFAVGIGAVIMILSIYTPFLNAFLHTAPLGLAGISIVLGYLVFRTILIELIKWKFRSSHE
ncbi:MAG: HAD-IC family P-type ATPase [Patescibacteria group bacterium]